MNPWFGLLRKILKKCRKDQEQHSTLCETVDKYEGEWGICTIVDLRKRTIGFDIGPGQFITDERVLLI